MSVPEEKKKLRAGLRQRIAALTPDYIKKSNRGIAQNVPSHPCCQKVKTISCFAGTASETDTNILTEQVPSNGKRVTIPLCIGRGTMEVWEIYSSAELHNGVMEIPGPATNSIPVTPVEIDFAILPCVSYGRQGSRLGYGDGCYDRFLGQASFYSVLICQERLLCEQVPTEPYDITVPVVITEAGRFSHE